MERTQNHVWLGSSILLIFIYPGFDCDSGGVPGVSMTLEKWLVTQIMGSLTHVYFVS